MCLMCVNELTPAAGDGPFSRDAGLTEGRSPRHLLDPSKVPSAHKHTHAVILYSVVYILVLLVKILQAQFLKSDKCHDVYYICAVFTCLG